MGETTHTTLVVGGMTCGGCAGNVQRALEAVVGVTSAEVNHVEGNANVAHSGVDKSDLEAAVSRAGYSVGDTSGASGLQQLGSPPTSTARISAPDANVSMLSVRNCTVLLALARVASKTPVAPASPMSCA